MTRLLLGNSGAPRWYSLDRARFREYLDALVGWGATSAEVVLHHGPADERTARVHVLDNDWDWVLDGYRARGLDVQFHVSLDPRFATDRWADDRAGLQREYLPLIELVGAVAVDQSATTLVLHGAGSTDRTIAENRRTTVGLLSWLAERFEGLPAGTGVALELGARKESRPTAAGRSRDDVLSIVEAIGSERVGVCWDVAHDLENASVEPDWVAQPSGRFLSRVRHVHLHDLDEDGLAHYPLLLGRVPVESPIRALAAVGRTPTITMEVRWMCAVQLGDPWVMLGRSYEVVRAPLDRPA